MENSMKNKSKKMMLFSLIIMLSFSLLSLIVAFSIKNIPENISYRYVNQRIEKRSWHDSYEIINDIICLFELCITMITTIVFIIAKVKTHEKIMKKTISLWVVLVISTIALLLSNTVVTGLSDENDYSPKYYEFSDNQHTLVFEERSFLLYGEGYIFQIQDDNSAILLERFTTDDGGRNNGMYDVIWFNDHAEITYHTFVTENDKKTVVVNFK